MLSNISIHSFLKSRDIIIRPWTDNMMGAARITLHLGNTILIPNPGVIVDIKKKVLPTYEKKVISDAEPFKLETDGFVIGETFEEIGISEKIGMILEGRSTLARLGISVVQTAMIIDTGQKPKKMTLEIKNSGPNPVLLYPKMKFCRACFFLLHPASSIRYDDDGKYGVGDKNEPIFDEEFGHHC